MEMGSSSNARQTKEGPTTELPFIVDLGFKDSILEAEAGLLFEDEVNSENEDDEELIHARLLLKKLVTNSKIAGKSKYHNTTGNETLVQEEVGEEVDLEDDGNETEYFSSSDEGSYKSGCDNEEEDIVREKSRFPSFKPTDNVDFNLGMSFESKSEVKDAVNKYSVSKRYPFYWAKNCSTMLRAKCSNLNKTCTWMAYFGIENRSSSKKWVMKTYHPDHTCNPGWQIPSATAKWLVQNFFNTKPGVSEMKTSAMKEMVKRELNCDVSLEQMKKAKSIIRKQEKGNIEAEYNNLEDYKAEILRSNAGNTCILQIKQPSDVFERFYVCFDSCKRGFLEGCRRLIGIDGAFLKSEVKGEILTAVARDANNQMFPIAWAVVGSETKATWKWFLENLRDDLQIGRGAGWAFVSDQQKGLMPALYETLPEVEHRRCARHIYAIWRRSHPGIELQRQFWKCCKAASKREFEQNLEGLKSLSPTAHEDILKVDPKFWCRAFFDRSIKCETVDNNLCEAFNGAIVPARSQLGYSQLEYIRKLVMQRLTKNRDLADKWVGQLGPRIRRRINNIIKASNYWRVQFNGADGYEVSCGSDTYLVDLANRSCLCEQWDVSGIPCKHAICAIRYKGHPIEDYVSNWYKKDMYRHTYSFMMTPLAGPLFWPKTNIKVLPAALKEKELGRPKKNRIKELGEFPRSGKLPKRGTTITCQLCFKKGHNKKGCPSKEQILHGNSTFPSDDLEGGSSNPTHVSSNLEEEANGPTEPAAQANVGGNTLHAYFTENQSSEDTGADGVFQWRGNKAITATGLERLRARNAKEKNANAVRLRKRAAEEVEFHADATTARQRFHALYDSMEDNDGQ
ncbi:unnamed protein product [Cuscuta epithymum]|uniref:SWIM-type domain-containing protein n=1 Tax=Cuscuta epithymum TaxID=186058 RepID=A0AAV0CTP5_9ASTE|nr:unnamed protein product [Cuscuta epithymum]